MTIFPDSHMLRRAWRRWIASVQLRHERRASAVGEGPLVFAVMRNEMLRLPRFLSHYRQLGAAGFVVVENNSTDDTADFLSRQEDVLLYRTSGNFLRKEAWLDFMLRRHGGSRWCVVADADELLDFPGSEEIGLRGLAKYLELGGWNTLHAILLDLYPPGHLGAVKYRSGDDYRNYEWFFDPLTSLRRVPRTFWKGSGLDYRFEGGVRGRAFGVSNCCSKFPFFKFDRGMFLHDGQHYLEGAHIAPMRGVLYHFKYLQDFVTHAQEEVRRGQHWRGGSEYRRYVEAAEQSGGDLALRNENSIKLQCMHQLEDCGFVICPADYRAFVRSRGAASPS